MYDTQREYDLDEALLKQDTDKKIVRDGQYVYFSNLLGKYNDFLACYKAKYKGEHNCVTAKDWYEHVLKRIKEEEDTIIKLQKIYYYLFNKKSIYKFGTFLRQKKLYSHNNCFASTMENAFMLRKAFINIDVIKKYKKIIALFEKEYGKLETLEEIS